MARTWLSVTVELIGGRGEELWPWPGRIFAVGPSHTFMDLADAINDAFGRWDRSHLSLFTLADGQVITDVSTGAEMAESAGGPISAPLDIESAKVGRVLKPGAEFQFTFDLGDQWTHRCVVAEEKIDPLEELGLRPDPRCRTGDGEPSRTSTGAGGRPMTGRAGHRGDRASRIRCCSTLGPLGAVAGAGSGRASCIDCRQ